MDDRLSDFTRDGRVVPLAAMAVIVGALGTVAARALAALIALATNLAFHGRWSVSDATPGGSPLGLWVVLVPAAGGLVVGLMARYGSERIRGHGIPEALEAILIGGSRITPKVAILKPLSSADVDRHRGAVRRRGADHHDGRCARLDLRPVLPPDRGGAQDAARRRRGGGHVGDLRDAARGGAAGGRTAAVRMEAAQLHPGGARGGGRGGPAGSAVRRGPDLPGRAAHGASPRRALVAAPSPWESSRARARASSPTVYGFEDLFARLPIHWMWWPAIGGLGVGSRGLLDPRASVSAMTRSVPLLAGRRRAAGARLLVAAKALVWSFSLGSGTSGASSRRC